MLRKLSVSVLLAAAGSVAAFAQQPTAPADERVQRTMFITPFESSYLGVQTREITKENFSKYGLASVQGVAVENVVENSPAASAGLQKGDVIVRFEGEEVTSIRKLNRLISEVAPDHQAKVTILRGGSGEREINVTIGKRNLQHLQPGGLRVERPLLAMPPMPRTLRTAPLPPMGGNSGDGDVFIWRGGASRHIGIGVVPLNKQLGDYFGVAEGKGLLVDNIRENSPAAKAGLKAGDVIVEADGKEIKGTADLIRAVNEKKEGDVSLTVVRDKNRQTVRVTPEISKHGMMNDERYFEDAPNLLNFQMPTPRVY